MVDRARVRGVTRYNREAPAERLYQVAPLTSTLSDILSISASEKCIVFLWSPWSLHHSAYYLVSCIYVIWFPNHYILCYRSLIGLTKLYMNHLWYMYFLFPLLSTTPTPTPTPTPCQTPQHNRLYGTIAAPWDYTEAFRLTGRLRDITTAQFFCSPPQPGYMTSNIMIYKNMILPVLEFGDIFLPSATHKVRKKLQTL